MGKRGWAFLLIGLLAGLLVAQVPALWAHTGGQGMMEGMMGSGMMRAMMSMMHGNMGAMHDDGAGCPMMGGMDDGAMMGETDHAAMQEMCAQMATKGMDMEHCQAMMQQCQAMMGGQAHDQ